MGKLLITGCTGFLGGCVLSYALKKYNIKDILILARTAENYPALTRVQDNLARFGLSPEITSQLTGSNIIEGDLAQPELFLNNPYLNEVTHVINCAAVASFGKNPLIWKVNVEGTFAFAKRMSEIASLQRFVHVGTAMSCLPTPGHNIKESLIIADNSQHIVDYTRAKAAIERKMREELPELPLVIARPSIIVGHSELGCQPSSSIFWVFKMALTLGKFMCNLQDRIDVVPVDFCAEALLALTENENVKNEIYHISAGPEYSVNFAEIDQAMAQAGGTEPVADNYRMVDMGYFMGIRKSFPLLFGECNERIILRAINLYGQFSRLNVTFDNTQLLHLGVSAPRKFTSYIDKCVDSTRGQSVTEMMACDFK